MLVYTLLTTVDGIERIFEMKYEIQTLNGIYIKYRIKSLLQFDKIIL